MARGSRARLKAHAREAFQTVARTRGGMKCGTSPRGAKNRVCLATHAVPGMKCGRNPINGLYACSEKRGGGGRRRKKGRRR